MVSTSSIGGLISGIDTDSIVASLLATYSAPQTLLKNRLSTANAEVTALQSINTKTASLATAAKAFSGSDSLVSSPFRTSTATSSSSTVKTAVTGTPSAVSLTFEVTAVAAAHSVLTGVVTDSTTADPLTITKNGVSTTVTPATGSLDDVVAAINGSGAGVTASIITDDRSGDRRLLLGSSTTGLASAFTISGLTDDPDNPATVRTTGADAEIDLGGGARLHSATNTFKGLVPGISVTVSEVVPSVTVSTQQDTAQVTTAVTGLVASLNSVLSDISFHTKAPTAGTRASATAGGLLNGDSTMRTLSQDLLSSISGSVGANAISRAGISIDQYGAATFDAAVFGNLLASDPAAAEAALETFSTAVEKIAKDASGTLGSTTALIKNTKADASGFSDRIADWDVRISLRQSTLSKQWAALETSLSALKNQQGSLDAALNSLTGNNSNN